jgi:biopolymer transport protein ExbB
MNHHLLHFSTLYRPLIILILSCTLAGPCFAQEGETPAAESEMVPSPPVEESQHATGTDFAVIDKLKQSGKTGIALFLISVAGFSFAFERLYHLRKSRIIPEGLADRANTLWQNGDLAGVQQLAREHPSALGRAILVIVDHYASTQADVSTIAGDEASREIRYHLLKAYPLAVVATISPLLGLFGTVYGMIGAFESVALAGEMGDPSIMAGDISYALITTALGLLIAVPALAAYHYFRIRTRMFSFALEEQLSHLIDHWFGPASQESVQPATPADPEGV